MISQSSSETVRRVTFLPPPPKSVSLHEKQWLVGFFEGDGCIDVTQTQFIFIQQDISVLYKIRTLLGYGTVRKVLISGGNSHGRLTIRAQVHVGWFIQLIHGHLVLHKTTEKLNTLLRQYKLRDQLPAQYQTSPDPTLPSKDSAWLSGFFDAEGGFFPYFQRSESHKRSIRIRLRIFVDQSYEYEQLLALKENFQFGAIRRRSKESPHCRWEIMSFKDTQIFMQYIQKFPLRTQSKRLAFFHYYRLVRLISEKLHLTKEGFEKVRRFIESIQRLNKTRYKND